jgi:hypothetical protein
LRNQQSLVINTQSKQGKLTMAKYRTSFDINRNNYMVISLNGDGITADVHAGPFSEERANWVARGLNYIEENPLNARSIQLNQATYKQWVKQDAYFHFCKECGMIEFAGYTNEKDLKHYQRCFCCQLWIKRSTEMTEKVLIVERQGQRQYLSDAGAVSVPEKGQYGYRSAKSSLGHGGSKWKYHKLSAPEVTIETNNMWFGGDIPKHLYHLFAINAVIEDK